MGVRADKGRILARYITGSTGIPFVTWQGVGLSVPAPYEAAVTTSRNLRNWQQDIATLPVDKPHIAIRYDRDLPDVAHAWVGMRLGAFAPLWQAHYENISDRIRGE